MRRPRLLSRRALVTLVALGVVAAPLAACTGGEGGTGRIRLDGRGGLDAAATARLLRRGDPVRTGGEISRGGVSAPVRARISWRPARAVFRFAVIAEGRVYRVQVRSIGPEAWLQRAPASQGAPGTPLIALTPRGERRWVALPKGSLPVLGFVTPFDPAALLDALARAKVRLRRSGAGSVRGVAAVRFSAKADPPRRLLPAGAQTLEVWVARSDGRPVRVILELPDGRIRYDLAPAGAADVRPPAPEGIQPPAAPQPSPEPAGPFTVVTEGEAAGVRYRVLAAPGTQGTTCWKVEATPPYVPAVRHNAGDASCLPPPPDTGTLDDRVTFPVDATDGTGFEMLGVLAPAGATLEVRLADGTRVPLGFADPARGFALYVGPEEPIAGFLTVRLGTAVAGCAPGELTDPAEAESLDAGGRAFARKAPWACLPED